jgi:hypothetical protein
MSACPLTQGMPEEARQDLARPSYDLGVLVVAANQPRCRSTALLQFGDALYDWFERCHGSTADSAGPRPLIQLREGRLEPIGDEPARIELELGPNASTGSTTRWLLAESWSAEPATGRDSRAVTLWLLRAVPWFLIEYFDAEVQRARRIPRSPLARLKRSLPSWIGLAFAAPLAMVVWLVLVLLLVVQALRVPGARRLAELAIHRLEQLVGAGYTQVKSPSAFEAMVTTAQQDLRWLAGQSRAVAVVAMSQGVPVAHEVVRRCGSNEVQLFLTIGSALRKLHLAKRIEWSEVPLARAIIYAFSFSGVCLLVSLFVLFGIFVAVVGIFARDVILTFLPLMYGFYAWVISGLLGRPARRKLHQQFVETRVEVDRDLVLDHPNWIELVATADPVPNGPLFDGPRLDGPHSVIVANRASAWRDHVNYLTNHEEVLPTIAAELARVANPPFELAALWPQFRENARRRRLWRLRWLVRARLAATVIGVLGATALLPHLDLAQPLARIIDVSADNPLMESFKQPVALLGALVSRRGAVFVLICAALALVIYSVLYALWSRWDRRVVSQALATDDEPRLSLDIEFLSKLLAVQVGAVGLLTLVSFGPLESWLSRAADFLYSRGGFDFLSQSFLEAVLLGMIAVFTYERVRDGLAWLLARCAIRSRLRRWRFRLPREGAVLWLIAEFRCLVDSKALVDNCLVVEPARYQLALVSWQGPAGYRLAPESQQVTSSEVTAAPRQAGDTSQPPSATTLLRDTAVLLDVRDAALESKTHNVWSRLMARLKRLQKRNTPEEQDTADLHLATRRDWKAFQQDLPRIEQLVKDVRLSISPSPTMTSAGSTRRSTASSRT